MAGWWGNDYWSSQYWGSQYWSQDSSAPVYDQELDVELQIYWASTQEYIPASAVPALYTQVANARLLWFGSAYQEYVPVLAQTYGQQGNVQIALSGGALQVWIGGAPPGEILQEADVAISLRPDSIQSYVPLVVLFEQVVALTEIEALYASGYTSASVNFLGYVTEVGRITCTLASTSDLWVNQVGEAGGLTGVAIYYRDGATRKPVGSVRKASDSVVLYPDTAAFAGLALKLLSGEVVFELGGYEALEDRSIPTVLPGLADFTVKVLQQ